MKNRLTDRDIAILASIEAAHYLTIEHLQWLHWPTVRAQFRAAREAGSQSGYGPSKSYERARFLANSGLITPIIRAANRGETTFARLRNAFCITERGCEMIAGRYGLSAEDLLYEVRREQSLLTLEHGVAIGTFYAALRSELEYRGLQLDGWMTDHRLSRDYDTVEVAQDSRPLPVLPDATFTLDGTRYFVEIDRATTRLSQWVKRARALRAYMHSAALKRRYEVDTFVVLVVAPSAERIQAIARTIAGLALEPSPSYRFTTEDRLHPSTIRRRWQMITGVSWPESMSRRGERATPRITLGDAPPLWIRQAAEQYAGDQGRPG